MAHHYERRCKNCDWTWDVPSGAATGGRTGPVAILLGLLRGKGLAGGGALGASVASQTGGPQADAVRGAEALGDLRAAQAICPRCQTSDFFTQTRVPGPITT